jgi:hypothetical protein
MKNHTYVQSIFILICTTILTLTACGRNSQAADQGSDQPEKAMDRAAYKYLPLAWELAQPAVPNAKAWSTYIFTQIAKAPSLLAGSSDIENFCPKYHSLNTNQKINFWGMLFSAVAKYESNFDPTNRYLETTLGIDPITGLPVQSEGLLQMSYQDIRDYPFCKFDWQKDQYLAPTDPNKTTFNPQINLACGVGVMNEQIARDNRIVLARGEHVYWSTLEIGASDNQIVAIEQITNTLPFCN